MRAIARRCFWPPESLTPRSPMTVSSPSGSDGDQLVQPCPAGGVPDLGLAGAEAAIGDVLADGAAEQEDVLLHDADLAAQRRERHVADVDAVDRDGAAVDLVEARQQRADRRLAGARGTDEGHGLAGPDRQVEAVENIASRRIAETDISVLDIAPELADIPRSGRSAMSGSGIEEGEVAPEAGNALRIGLDHRVDLLDRAEEHADQQQEADEAAGGEFALEHQIAAGNHHDHLDQAHAEIAERRARPP